MTVTGHRATAEAVVARPVHPPSPLAPKLWRINAAIRWTLLLALQGLWWWQAPDLLDVLRLPVLVATTVFGLLDLLVAPLVRYRVHRWSVTDHLVVSRSGWVVRDTKVVPLARVQSVTVTSGPTDRLLGLAGVAVSTASSAGPVRIVAVERAVADEVAADLTVLAGLAEDPDRDVPS